MYIYIYIYKHHEDYCNIQILYKSMIEIIYIYV
jgi:hypothetical protein